MKFMNETTVFVTPCKYHQDVFHQKSILFSNFLIENVKLYFRTYTNILFKLDLFIIRVRTLLLNKLLKDRTQN